MSIDGGTYCQCCISENGELQAFGERFERMVQWAIKEEKQLSREGAEDKIKAYMCIMPAWKFTRV